MQMVATVALTDDMVISDNVKSGDKVIIQKGTKVDNVVRKQLETFHIMGVSVFEPEDYATTYMEKIRLSKKFAQFENDYQANLVAYKAAVDYFIYKKVPFRLQDFKTIVSNLMPSNMSGKLLFSYLYLHKSDSDDMSYAHGLNVALLSKIVSRWMKLSEDETDKMIYSGFLFDIGKFMIPNGILWKPEKLSNLEYDLMKTHAFHGYYLLSHHSTNVPEQVLNATLQHHERNDGSGYPQKLTSGQIDPYARMMGILDVYEAMTTPRPHRQQLTPYQVVRHFEHEGLQKYDIEFYNMFLNHIVDEFTGSDIRLSDGRTGEVVMNNKHDLSRPVIKCGSDVIDLYKNRGVDIVELI